MHNTTDVGLSVKGKMGATTSKANEASGLITVSKGSEASSPKVDQDLVALRALPPVAPLIKEQPLLRSLFFSSAKQDSGLPELQPRNVSALCREFASLSRQAALPLCEEQRVISRKMSAVEALCARVLYLMALRSTELSGASATLHEIDDVAEAIREGQRAYNQCVARASALERLLDTLDSSRTPGGALG